MDKRDAQCVLEHEVDRGRAGRHRQGLTPVDRVGHSRVRYQNPKPKPQLLPKLTEMGRSFRKR
jgi:hypothetical protein